MNTKTKILQTALELYNNMGVKTVTSRHIASEMSISPGNLHYHFKHTNDIIQGLYEQLAAKFDQIISALQDVSGANLHTLKKFSLSCFELVYEYRFILLNYVEIGLRIPQISEHYGLLTQRRSDEFMNIFNQLIKKGIFREELPDQVWKAFFTQIFIVGDFWLSNNELTLKLSGDLAVKHYHEVFLNMFYPYLTESGIKDFSNLIKFRS